MPELFGTDGIRGIANEPPITTDMGHRLGQAVVAFCRSHGNPPRIVIGRDTRISGESLEEAISAGVLSVGGHISRAGEIPTPAVAYLARSLGAGAGIVVSASHNPFEYNGFKVFSSGGFKLSEEEEAEIEGLMIHRGPPGGRSGDGHLETLEDASDRYISFLLDGLSGDVDFRELNVVLDCANGATVHVAPVLFEMLGTRVEALFTTPDGKNINRNCGSQHTGTLCRQVLERGADVGLAFDGDGDRLIAVDEKGQTLTGDQLLTIYARTLKACGELKGNVVVSTVMSNMGLQQALRGFGIEQVAARVGDRHVMEAMKARKANLGGEDSGHIIFLDHHSTGDGLLSGLQLLRAIKILGQPLSKLSKLMTVFPQTLVNVRVKKKTELSNLPAVVEEIERIESMLAGKGRALVRFSGTEPVCRVMVEGEDRTKIQDYAGSIAAKITEALG